MLRSLRVLKRDIRRNYASMFVNCLNGCDISVLSRFLKHYCTRNVSLYQECPGIHYPPYVYMKGNDLIALHWAWKMRILPDMIVRIKDVKVCVRDDTDRSKIMAQLEVVGTKLHEYPLNLVLPSLTNMNCAEVAKTVPTNTMMPLHEETVCLESKFNASMETYAHYIPMTLPMEAYITGVLTFYLDEDKRIDGLEFKSNLDLSNVLFTSETVFY